MSLYLDTRFFMEEKKLVTLPEDLMVTPIHGKFNTDICHSETTGKWYVVHILTKPETIDGQEVYSGLVDSGSWVELARTFFDESFEYAPFYWGQTYKSSIMPEAVQYIPIWESVPTGRYDEEGLPTMKQVYKLITLMPYHFTVPTDNVTQYNFDTRFQVVDYGSDLLSLTRDLELYTGKTF